MFKKPKSKTRTEQEIREHMSQAARNDIRRRNEEKASNTNFTDLFAEDTANTTPNQK